MNNTSNAALAEPWKDLWNGDLTLTDKIIAEDFVAHAAPRGIEQFVRDYATVFAGESSG